uniref:CUB domain-containing protein n=1 Tax=Magallana gigas TaxID=29159 RepID=A0A8W8JXC5_MAGGI
MGVLSYFYLMTAVVASEKQQYTYSGNIDATLNGSTGIITSPGYPGNYPNNAAYVWTLKTENLKASVIFNFQDFDIKKYKDTSYCEDYLEVYKTEPCCFKAIHRCGKFEPFSLTVNGSVMNIHFVSDHLHNTKGFNLTWKVNIPRTSAVSKTSKWTSKIQTKSSAKTMSTTGPKKCGTTDREIPTSKTENIMRTSSLTERSSRQPQLHTAARDEPQTVVQPTPPQASTSPVELSAPQSPTTSVSAMQVTEPTVPKAQMTTHKLNTLLSTTDNSRKASTLKPTELTTPQQNSTTVYLVAGIGVVELTVIALVIYIVRQRRSKMSIGQNAKDKNHPVPRKSVASDGNLYESIPLEHFSIEDTTPEENWVYIEVPEHMYDKTFEHRPRVNVNPNLYHLIS